MAKTITRVEDFKKGFIYEMRNNPENEFKTNLEIVCTGVWATDDSNSSNATFEETGEANGEYGMTVYQELLEDPTYIYVDLEKEADESLYL